MDDNTEGLIIWKWETLSWSGDWAQLCQLFLHPKAALKRSEVCPWTSPCPKGKQNSICCLLLLITPDAHAVLAFFPCPGLGVRGTLLCPSCCPPALPLWATTLGHSWTPLSDHVQDEHSLFRSILGFSAPSPDVLDAGKGKWESMCLAENNLGGFVWGQDLCSLGLSYHEEDMSQCCVSWGLVPTSQQETSAAAHSWLVYFSSLSIHTKCLKHSAVLVPWDIREMHCQMCHISSKTLLRPHEILLLSNNGLRASIRPHYTPQIISKWQRHDSG